jgi:hypothetical protein
MFQMLTWKYIYIILAPAENKGIRIALVLKVENSGCSSFGSNQVSSKHVTWVFGTMLSLIKQAVCGIKELILSMFSLMQVSHNT